MKIDKLALAAGSALVLATTLPSVAGAQQRGHQAHRSGNAEATSDMRSRIAAAIDRVRVTEEHGKLAPARSATLRRQLAQAQPEMTRLTRRLGQLNAAQLAPYDQMIVAIDAELGAAAVGRPVGNNGLPSAEVTAYVRTHGRLGYRNARIEHDARRCAVYQGIAKDGKPRRELLRDRSGRPICLRR